jgi:hypothetical protein
VILLPPDISRFVNAKVIPSDDSLYKQLLATDTTPEPISVGSVWQSYDGSELYLVLGHNESSVIILVLEESYDRTRSIRSHKLVALPSYLRAGKRIV